jgi:NAD+ kinase
MSSPLNPPRRIAVVAHPKLPVAVTEAQLVYDFLGQYGLSSLAWASIYDDAIQQRVKNGEFDVLIALGGDGTMLRAGHLCAPLGVPILGINMGHFGFLTEVLQDQWRPMLPELLAGNYWLENRMTLRAEHWRADRFLGSYSVLNEVVVARGQVVRAIRLAASVDGYPLANFVADALIAATPTGSTAYALAAGGPIMPPELRNILIIPVAPHLSVDRAVILSEGSYVTITAYTDHQALLSVDGQSPEMMADGDVVRVESGDDTVKFVRFQDRGYFYRNITRYMEQNPSAGGVK